MLFKNFGRNFAQFTSLCSLSRQRGGRERKIESGKMESGKKIYLQGSKGRKFVFEMCVHVGTKELILMSAEYE